MRRFGLVFNPGRPEQALVGLDEVVVRYLDDGWMGQCVLLCRKQEDERKSA